MRPALTILWLTLGLLGAAGAATAQTPTPPAPTPDRFAVSVVTMYPGDALFTGFGHVAIRVQDSLEGLDLSFDCGTYDSSDPLIGWHFLTGKLDYFCSRNRFQTMLDWYLKDFSGAVEQKLALSQPKATALLISLLDYTAPGRNNYRYHHFHNNCSTRLRDLLDTAYDGALAAQARDVPVPQSFRDLINASFEAPSFAIPRWLVFGLLNGEIDRPVDRWRRAFLPSFLAEELTALRYQGKPVVTQVVTIKPGARPFPPDPSPLQGLVGALLLLLALSWPWLLPRKGFRLRRAFLAVGLGFGAFYGSVMAIAWAFAPYPETAPNWNFLMFNPLLLVFFGGALGAARRGKDGPLLKWFLRVYPVLAALLLLAWGLGLIEQFVLPYGTAALCLALPALADQFFPSRPFSSDTPHPALRATFPQGGKDVRKGRLP